MNKYPLGYDGFVIYNNYYEKSVSNLVNFFKKNGQSLLAVSVDPSIPQFDRIYEHVWVIGSKNLGINSDFEKNILEYFKFRSFFSYTSRGYRIFPFRIK